MSDEESDVESLSETEEGKSPCPQKASNGVGWNLIKDIAIKDLFLQNDPQVILSEIINHLENLLLPEHHELLKASGPDFIKSLLDVELTPQQTMEYPTCIIILSKVCFALGQKSICDTVSRAKEIKVTEKNLNSFFTKVDLLTNRLTQYLAPPKMENTASMVVAFDGMKASFDTLNLSISNFITKTNHPADIDPDVYVSISRPSSPGSILPQSQQGTYPSVSIKGTEASSFFCDDEI